MEDVRPQVIQDEMPTPIVGDEIWKLILDRSSIPEVIIHNFKGEVWMRKWNDKKAEWEGWWEEKGEKLMNERGIRFFSSFLYSAMSPDKLVTFLTEDEVNRMALEMTKRVIYIIGERGEEFEIAASNRGYIIALLDHYYFTNLTASRKGTILNALKPSYERKEIYTQQPRKRIKIPGFG